MSRWYRAYEGTVTDPKLAEAALVAGCSRAVAIAAWHTILESAASAQEKGSFDTTPRRVAVTLGEPVASIEAVFSAFEELGMIDGRIVAAWQRRQFESDNSTERSRKLRERRRNDDATLQGRDATAPYITETDTEKKEEPSALPAKARKAKPLPRTLIAILPSPPTEYVEAAQRHGMPVHAIPPQFQKFQDYHTAKGNRMADWLAAWRTWCGNFNDYGPRVKNGKPSGIFESLDRLEAVVSGRPDQPSYCPEPNDGSSGGGGLQSSDFGVFRPAIGHR